MPAQLKPASKPAPTGGTLQAALDDEEMRRGITVRLMRAYCERLGGCTRACRRRGRCVAADALERASKP